MLTAHAPDDTYFYTLGQTDTDIVVEGYNERDNESESSDDLPHLWHRHDSFRRNIIGSFPHLWQALTIDMGWTVAEWRQRLEDEVTASENWTDPVIEVTGSTAGRALHADPAGPGGRQAIRCCAAAAQRDQQRRRRGPNRRGDRTHRGGRQPDRRGGHRRCGSPRRDSSVSKARQSAVCRRLDRRNPPPEPYELVTNEPTAAGRRGEMGLSAPAAAFPA